MSEDTQYVTKSRLVALVKQVVDARETGLISILTDTHHAVLMKFYAGKLIHLHSRTRDIADVIQVLNEADWVKFKFARVAMDDQPESMPIETFLQLIETEEYEDETTLTGPSRFSAVGALSAPPRSPINTAPKQLFEFLVDLAAEYLGPVAEVLVEEAFESHDEAASVIEAIAASIPDADQARAFREAAAGAMNIVPE